MAMSMFVPKEEAGKYTRTIPDAYVLADPNVEPGGSETKLARMLLLGWRVESSVIDAFNQYLLQYVQQIVSRLLRTVFFDVRDKFWYRYRLDNGRVGRPLYHDMIS